MIISRAQMSEKRNFGISAYRELLGDAGIPGHFCLFRNHEYLILTPSPSAYAGIAGIGRKRQEFLVIPYRCRNV